MRRMNPAYRKGDKGPLILEINFRLAGFGGLLPTDEFTELTEKGVKQFQTDYMKITPTGEVDSNTLDAIDEFCDKYRENVDNYKCKCGECDGFGKGQFKGEYRPGKSKIEAYHNYEYPGMHQSLLWAVSAARYYLTQKFDGKYSINCVSSGYRCWLHPITISKKTTNHMGKAVDLHFNKDGQRTRESSDMDLLRENIFCDEMGAPYNRGAFGWEINKFGLEPFEFKRGKKNGATSWVHVDVREFQSAKYLKDEYFIKSNAERFFNYKLLTINNNKK